MYYVFKSGMLAFFLQQSLYIHVYTIHMYFFQEFSEE